jgi:hypothetical protein
MVYNILAARRPLPVVATNRTEASRFAKRDGCGVSADPDEPAAIAGTARAVLVRPTSLLNMGWSARGLARTFDRVKQLHTFVGTIEEAAVE